MPIDREQQALDEMARTTGPRGVLWALVLGFLVLITVPTTAHLVSAPGSLWAVTAGLPKAFWSGLVEGGPFQASRQSLQAIDAFEAELRNGSPLAKQVRPATQTLMFRTLGVGNAQVLPGRDATRTERLGRVLYFRPAVQHAVGPGFLSRAWLTQRGRGGDAWSDAPTPDPRPAIRHFAEDLRRRGVELVVLPIPVKASVDGAPLGLGRGVVNPSWHGFRAGLERLGVGGPDVLKTLRGLDGARFLETDTHWRPEAMDAVAEAVAGALVDRGVERRRRLPRGPAVAYEGQGDLADLLGVWPDVVAPDRVGVAPLVRPNVRDGARVLVLGDSFAGIYEDPSLGFGDQGGFADALAHHLGQPVDAIVVNAGGAWQTRQALADQVERLETVDVVVWMFTARELSLGDWREVRLPAVDAVVDPRWVRLPEGAGEGTVRGVVRAIAPAADPRASAYPDQVVALSVAVDGVPAGQPGSVAWLMAWGLRDRTLQPAARLSVGDAVEVTVSDFDAAPKQAQSAGRSELADRPTAVPLLWVERWEAP